MTTEKFGLVGIGLAGTALVGVALALAPLSACAQQFPEGATTLSAAEIKKQLDDKVFSVQLADGTTWRLEYKSNGYFFVNTSTGFKSSGQWQTEEGRLCGNLKGRDRSCNDVRLSSGLIHLKRDSGEIIQFQPK